MKYSSHTGTLIGIFVLGAAIGGTLGILFAPAKGSKTRKRISGKSDDLKNAVTEKFNGFLEDIQDEVDAVKEKALEFIETGSNKSKKQNGSASR